MSEHKFKYSPLALIAGVLAAALLPPEPMTPSAWAGKNFVLPDGERRGELIDMARTPHLLEVVDALGPDATDNEVAVMKSAQSAFTTALQIVICHSIDRDPCDMMVVQPTDSALRDFNSQKLSRALEASPAMRRKVRPYIARSGKASTTYEKKFAGGDYALFLAAATSTADLRAKTIKKAFCDEVDEYLDDPDQGDPLDLVEGRQIQFLRSGEWKRAYISTPTILGSSKIERKFLAGDQRRWKMQCPGCGERFAFEWGPNFVFEKVAPYKSHYVVPCCGHIVESYEKFDVYLTGEWQADAPGLGKFKSYHFDALASPFVPWEVIARKWVEAEGDAAKLKVFYNLWLGLPFEVKGDAPDHSRLLALREDYQRARIPPRGLLLTAAADVQAAGIYVEVVAFASNRESWVVEALFLDGDTTDPDAGAFAKLAEFYEREWLDSFAGRRRVDAFGIDSGFRSHVVYSWSRNRPNAFALKGADGWSRPAIAFSGPVDIDLGGRKIKQGAALWTVGTFTIKNQLYADLRKTRLVEGAEVEPSGACHHGTWLDEVYFVQLTNEHLAERRFRGFVRKEWVSRGPNHFLDCRVYNIALADWLGLGRLTADEWARLAQLRGVPAELRSPDLFAPESVKLAAAKGDQAAPIASPSSSETPPARKPAAPAGPTRRSMPSSFMG